MRIEANGVELAVETFGEPTDLALLLIGVTMDSWPSELCAGFTGRYVVRYDLRDTGESTYVNPAKPGYDLRDLVTDASELLRALGIEQAHVAGLGVGGFVAQLLALDHPERVTGLTLVSTRPVAPGRIDADLPDHDAAVMKRLFAAPPPDWTDRESVVAHQVAAARLLAGSRGFDETDVRATAEAIHTRSAPTAAAQSASHQGIVFAALNCKPRWRERLGDIAVPTLVVHGDEDPFFPHGNGEALAAEIPGARLLTLTGIGQGLPRVSWPQVTDAMLRLGHASP